MKYYSYDFSVGRLWVAADDGDHIAEISWSEPEGIREPTPATERAARQLEEYFAGERTAFDLPLRLRGTDFQRRVWDLLLRIPYGGVRTYGELARELGTAGAARAVGMACHNNPVSIVVPCHRVVGSGGRLTGYAGGLDRKCFLLNLEREKGLF